MRRWLAVAAGCWAAGLAAFGGAGGAEIATDNDVLVLNKQNFQEAIKDNRFILVEFYAPWCGHCKQFAPEYAAAARQLKKTDPPVPLAKVDATKEFEIAEDYGVRGYPTLRLFIDGRDQEYTGGRTEQNIVSWVLKKAGPPAFPLADVGAAEAFERDHGLAVVGLFEEGASRAAFEAAARQVEDVMFAYSTAAPVVARYQVRPPALRMFFPHDEKVADFDGDTQSVEAMERFVKAYKLPLIVRFDGETAPEIFSDGRQVLFLIRDPDEKGKAAEAEFRKVAPTLRRRLVLSICGSAEPMDQRLMDYISVDAGELPALRLVRNPMANMTKYRPESGEITEASVAAFVRDVDAGRLRPWLKSAAPPASQEGPVVELVGSTFDSVVKDPNKDVLVQFYAPWCGHCKKFEPVYRDLAERLAGVGSLTVAKIDATANDVADVFVEGFPTIKFWRAGHKDQPIDYDSDRDVNSFLAWLEARATIPFQRKQLPRSEL